VTHELLWSALNAQQANATLAGRPLRAAAEELIRVYTPRRTRLMALDAAGERIIGAALVLSDAPLEVFDYSDAFPRGLSCLLVGGFVAGPVGIEDAAAAAIGAGAAKVEAAVIGGWTGPVAGVSRVRDLGRAHTRVA
jgi:hypothetical protein